MAPYRITRSRPLSTPHSPRTCVTPLFLLLLFWTLYFPLFLFEYFQNRHGTSMSSLRDVGVSLAARCFIVKCAWSTSNDKTFSTKNNKVKEETVWHLSSISFRRMAIFAASCSSFFQKKKLFINFGSKFPLTLQAISLKGLELKGTVTGTGISVRGGTRSTLFTNKRLQQQHLLPLNQSLLFQLIEFSRRFKPTNHRLQQSFMMKSKQITRALIEFRPEK